MLSTHPSRKVYTQGAKGASRLQGKDLTHRVSMDFTIEKVIEIAFIYLGDPEDGSRARFLNILNAPVDVGTFFSRMSFWTRTISMMQVLTLGSRVRGRREVSGPGFKTDDQIASGGKEGHHDRVAEATCIGDMFLHREANPHCLQCVEAKCGDAVDADEMR